MLLFLSYSAYTVHASVSMLVLLYASLYCSSLVNLARLLHRLVHLCSCSGLANAIFVISLTMLGMCIYPDLFSSRKANLATFTYAGLEHLSNFI